MWLFPNAIALTVTAPVPGTKRKADKGGGGQWGKAKKLDFHDCPSSVVLYLSDVSRPEDYIKTGCLKWNLHMLEGVD